MGAPPAPPTNSHSVSSLGSKRGPRAAVEAAAEVERREATERREAAAAAAEAEVKQREAAAAAAEGEVERREAASLRELGRITRERIQVLKLSQGSHPRAAARRSHARPLLWQLQREKEGAATVAADLAVAREAQLQQLAQGGAAACCLPAVCLLFAC